MTAARILDEPFQALSERGIFVGSREIADGDEDELLVEESRTIESRLPAVRRASGAARVVARRLFRRLGVEPSAIPRSASGAPVWPNGVVGSLAHDDAVAVAAVALGRNAIALGIDVEPAAPLPAEMRDLVTTPRERHATGGDLQTARILFAAKEAIYKATHPLDGRFLEYHDIEVDLAAGHARTRQGLLLSLHVCTNPRIVAVAIINIRRLSDQARRDA